MKHFKIIIITGLSGSGKSGALAAFEDTGFYCVDNMPVKLLPKFLDLPIQSDIRLAGIALVMDLRERGFLAAFPQIHSELTQKGYNIEVLFLQAEESIILRRYSQTRRHHPLSQDRSLIEGIRTEIEQLAPIKALADRIIDTSTYTIHDLKALIFTIAENYSASVPMRITVLSFGYKHGIPQEADLIMDVRFIANPFFEPQLKPLDGRNEAVKHFVLNNAGTQEFLQKFYELVDFLLPLYEKEGKAYLTIAVGCTGGQHRSVAIADALYSHINKPGRKVKLSHRDVDLKL